MKELLIILLNLIFLAIMWIVLSSKIKRNSIPSRIEEYTREVERLIIELNRALDDVVSISEEKVEELKALIKRSEKILKKARSSGFSSNDNINIEGTKEAPLIGNQRQSEKIKENKVNTDSKKVDIPPDSKVIKGSLIEKVSHLSSMGFSREDISENLGITPAEVDFLILLAARKT